MNSILEKRASGVLLHPTSLPSAGPIGTIGREAIDFVLWLQAARQQLWQMLPIGPTGGDGSPYNSPSSMASSLDLIDLGLLAEMGLVPPEETDTGESTVQVDYASAFERTAKMLDRLPAAASSWPSDVVERYEQFCTEEAFWLDDHTLFFVLKEEYGGRAWTEWPTAIATREPQALAAVRERLAAQQEAHKIGQFLFQEQWVDLKRFANQCGIALVGDVPIYVGTDSADVWCHPDIFDIDSDGRPIHVSGVPPDAFSDTGQRWGGALYRWDRLADTDYAWWIDRLKRTYELFDVVRIDHFRAFDAYWEIPADEETAINGKWRQGPGRALFEAVTRELGPLPVIAEDLGIITDSVRELRDALGFPGMRVLQFAYDSDDENPHLPANFTPQSVVYPGTHDNNTSLGWYRKASDYALGRLHKRLGEIPEDPSWALIEIAMRSVANTSVVTVQDLLALGTEARMNTPATIQGNWSWRAPLGAFAPELARKLAQLTEITGRATSS